MTDTTTTVDLSIDCQCARTANQPVTMSVYHGRITDVWCAVCHRPLLNGTQIEKLSTFAEHIPATVTLMMDLPDGGVVANPESIAAAAASDLWHHLTPEVEDGA